MTMASLSEDKRKQDLVQNLSNNKINPKRALFKTIKDSGGLRGAENVSSLPRNVRQVKKHKTSAGSYILCSIKRQQ